MHYYTSNGGRIINNKTCPDSYNDIIVPTDSLKKNKTSLDQLTFPTVMEFMRNENITTITGLLNALPMHYRTNFSLVEATRGEGQSDVNFPRIVLFGPDGRFLLNVGTKPEDPKYNLLDGAELDEKTGRWIFSQLDFTKRKPMLISEPKACLRCHGSKEPRPIWGTSLDWPGVFGDNEAPGPSGDALSNRHIKRMNEIKSGHGGSDRFDFLVWGENEKFRSGGFRRIANNAFGPELIVSNLVIGSAAGRGAFLRLKNKKPQLYCELREELLLLAYHQENAEILDKSEYEAIMSKITNQDTLDTPINKLLRTLGLDAKESFSLATLAEEEPPQPDWSLGDGDMYEQIYLQVLHDLAQNDPEVKRILSTTPSKFPIFKCPDVVNNVMELVEHKMLHMYELRGKDRYEVNKVYYPLEVERVFDLVLAPVETKLCKHLKKKI